MCSRFQYQCREFAIESFRRLFNKIMLNKLDIAKATDREEFMIMLPMTDQEEARVLAQKICDVTAATEVIVENTAIHYTTSIGTIAIRVDNKTPVSQESIDKYVTRVDEKLYLAKERGRNRVE